jgi:hypothetical protein
LSQDKLRELEEALVSSTEGWCLERLMGLRAALWRDLQAFRKAALGPSTPPETKPKQPHLAPPNLRAPVSKEQELPAPPAPPVVMHVDELANALASHVLPVD